jgi:hypothetical protein
LSHLGQWSLGGVVEANAAEVAPDVVADTALSERATEHMSVWVPEIPLTGRDLPFVTDGHRHDRPVALRLVYLIPQATADTAGAAAVHGYLLATVPARAGLDHARRGLLPRRLRASA